MPTYNPEVGRSQVGQNIVYDDDLIFYYDMYNEYTSFKGKPTTNLLSEPNGFTTWDLSSVSQENVFAVPYKKLVENTSSSSSFALLNSSVTFGLDYTMSVYAKKSERSFVQLAPSTGFSQGSYANYDLDTGTITGSFPANAASMEYIKVGEYKGWWRCQYTATSNLTTTSGRILVAIVPVSTSTRLQSYASIAGYGIYLRDMQMEQSSFATPFVDGTRSNTQSLLDLTGNNTITTSNLVYDANDFSFDGTNSEISTGYTPGTGVAAAGCTIECWYKGTKTARNHLWSWGQSSVNNLDMNFNDGAYALWLYWDGGGSNAIRFTDAQFGDNFFTDSQVHHIVFTHSGSTNTVYFDGVALTPSDTIGTQTFSSTNGATGQLTISESPRFAGDVYTTRVYERALSAAEVRQNFIATRSKFGL